MIVTTFYPNNGFSGLDDVLKARDITNFSFIGSEQREIFVEVRYFFVTSKYKLLVKIPDSKGVVKNIGGEFTTKENVRASLVMIMTKEGFKESTINLPNKEIMSFDIGSNTFEFEDIIDSNKNSIGDIVEITYTSQFPVYPMRSLIERPSHYETKTMTRVGFLKLYNENPENENDPMYEISFGSTTYSFKKNDPSLVSIIVLHKVGNTEDYIEGLVKHNFKDKDHDTIKLVGTDKVLVTLDFFTLRNTSLQGYRVFNPFMDVIINNKVYGKDEIEQVMNSK